MTRPYFFNSDAYLLLEAKRLGAAASSLSLSDGSVVKFLTRPVPRSNLRDAVSVYGYPDLDQRPFPPGTVETNRLLAELLPQARAEGLVSAYLRLGLDQTVDEPAVTSGAWRSKIGEAVVVDLQRDWSGIFISFRGRLRSQLRNGPSLAFDISTDVEPFHRMYTENMARVGASAGYFFTLDYLVELLGIPGAELITASDATGPVSGAISVAHGDRVYYHLGATGDRGLAVSPLRHVLAYLAERHAMGPYTQLVLGGGVGGGDDELMRFKRGFSKETLPVFALKLITNPDLYAELNGGDTGTGEGFFPAYRARVDQRGSQSA